MMIRDWVSVVTLLLGLGCLAWVLIDGIAEARKTGRWGSVAIYAAMNAAMWACIIEGIWVYALKGGAD